MKRYSLISLICMGLGTISLSSLARADDPTSDWGGPYIGAQAGYDWGNFKNNRGVSGPRGSNDSFEGGGQVGNNWQYDHLVWGMEADAAALDVESGTPRSNFDEDWMATLRGRLGFAVNQIMPYATAGLGLTDVNLKVPGVGSNSSVQPGPAVGGGLDFQLPDYGISHWSGRIEYMYVDVPKDNSNIGGQAISGGSNNNIVRIGMNYKF